ncbi:MAG TPA: SAM-dependent methyltransferase [Pyrinomonadaceae bacterium]|nr:SAM-dependent methyltransferase [Pyrinomonadaceae bacterium]
MSDAIENFLDELTKSLSSASFVKLTLSNYKGAEPHLQKINARLIDTKRGQQVSFQNNYETRQTVKNYDATEVVNAVRSSLSSGFRSSHLFTTANDFQLTVGKRNSRLIKGKPTFVDKPSTSHDREKQTLVDSSAFYLKALGITTDKGEVRAQQRDKWRQINKYVEVLRDHFDRSALKDIDGLKIVDMGSGKGYLTFAAYDYFSNVRGLKVEMTGVEVRDDLVRLCNEIAASAGFDGLHFVSGSIEDFALTEVDILIALHACDTATDDALFKGISAQAEIIIAAPCCHKEIRRQMKPPDVLKDILKYGSMAEREAETLTDGLRAMLLEERGYATKVFEFVPTEHTPKNNMIVAIRNDDGRTTDDRLKQQIAAVKAFYGIAEQRLENLLA